MDIPPPTALVNNLKCGVTAREFSTGAAKRATKRANWRAILEESPIRALPDSHLTPKQKATAAVINSRGIGTAKYRVNLPPMKLNGTNHMNAQKNMKNLPSPSRLLK